MTPIRYNKPRCSVFYALVSKFTNLKQQAKAPMSDNADTTPTTAKLRKVRPVSINTGVAQVALGNIERLTESQIDGVLTNLFHQLLADFVNPEILDWVVAQEVVLHTRRLWQCAAR